MNEEDWPDAYVEEYWDESDLYRRVLPRVREDPMDWMTLEQFDEWLDVAMDYELLLRRTRGGVWRFRESFYERNQHLREPELLCW